MKVYLVDYKPIYPIGGGVAVIVAVNERQMMQLLLAHPKTPSDIKDRINSIEETPVGFPKVIINENGDY